MHALVFAALSAEKVPCIPPEATDEKNLPPLTTPSVPKHTDLEAKNSSFSSKDDLGHEQKKQPHGVTTTKRYRVVVKDGIAFRNAPRIRAVFSDERGIPYGSVLEARGLSAGELEQARVESRRHIEENGEECNKAEDWVRDTVSGYWLPKCMFGYQILRCLEAEERPGICRTASDDRIFNAAGLISAMRLSPAIGSQRANGNGVPPLEDVQPLKRPSSAPSTDQEYQIQTLPRNRRGKAGLRRPKQPKTAYNFYQLAVRTQISSELKKSMAMAAASGKGGRIMSQERLNQEVMRLIGKRWRSLDPTQREHYKALANEDSQRYQRELEIVERHTQKHHPKRFLPGESHAQPSSSTEISSPYARPMSHYSPALSSRSTSRRARRSPAIRPSPAYNPPPVTSLDDNAKPLSLQPFLPDVEPRSKRLRAKRAAAAAKAAKAAAAIGGVSGEVGDWGQARM